MQRRKLRHRLAQSNLPRMDAHCAERTRGECTGHAKERTLGTKGHVHVCACVFTHVCVCGRGYLHFGGEKVRGSTFRI